MNTCRMAFLRTLALPGLALALALSPKASAAEVFFVDPVAGSDTNPGTSRAAPWKTIPGTRTLDDARFLNAQWGGIGPKHRLGPGDIIEIKAGTRMDAKLGGRLLIDPSFYKGGTSGAPVVVQVSATWGHGPFVLDARDMSVPKWGASLAVSKVDHVQVRGAGPAGRFVVRNAEGAWAVAAAGRSDDHQEGMIFSYLEVAHAAEGGMNLSFSDNFAVENSIAHDNGTIGFVVGGINDETSTLGMFSDSEAYNNGRTPEGSGIQHGFGLYGAMNVIYLRCRSHHNGRDGFDFGSVRNSSDARATVVDSVSYANGEDGFGASGGTGSTLYTYVNSVAFDNAQAGWNIYGGGQASLYHVIAHGNGNQKSYGGNFMIYSEGAFTTRVTIRNSIGYKPKAYANVYSYNSRGAITHISSDNNLWVPRDADSEVFAETPFGKTYTYRDKPGWAGPDDKLGVRYDPGFKAVSEGDMGANDYHVTARSSPAVAAGARLGAAYTDYDRGGDPRTGVPDIGIYQFAGAPGPEERRARK